MNNQQWIELAHGHASVGDPREAAECLLNATQGIDRVGTPTKALKLMVQHGNRFTFNSPTVIMVAAYMAAIELDRERRDEADSL